MAESTTHEQLEQFIAQIKDVIADKNLEGMRSLAIRAIIDQYGEYMFPGIRELPVDCPIRVKPDLRGMGCDGGYDPIPPQQIEFDASLTSLERFTTLLRAAIQFYAYSGPAELSFGSNLYTRWGFLHLDQSGAPNTRFFGLHQDMVRYLTEHACLRLSLGQQVWMQRGTSAHIRQLLTTSIVSKELLLNAYFGESFLNLVAAINRPTMPHLFEKLGELSDLVDNAHLCEFPPYAIRGYEDQYSQAALTLLS